MTFDCVLCVYALTNANRAGFFSDQGFSCPGDLVILSAKSGAKGLKEKCIFLHLELRKLNNKKPYRSTFSWTKLGFL